jgi:O-antigen ligase
LPPDATEPTVPSEPPSGEWMPWDPDHMNAPADGKVPSLVRNDLFSRAFAVLKKFWPFGTGRDSLYMYGWGHQSTHNLFLDAVVCYGVFAGVVYLALVLFPLAHAAIVHRKSRLGKVFLIGFVFLLLYSMVEPLLSNKSLVVLAVWMLYAVLIFDKSVLEKDTGNEMC